MPRVDVRADASLAARDPDLPGLAVVLDGARLAEVIDRRLPDAGVLAAEPVYVRYKPRTACLVALRVTLVSGEVVDAYLILHRPDAGDKRLKHVARATNGGPLGAGAVALDPLPAVLYPFPNDRRVHGLPTLADPVRRRDLLRRMVPDRPDLWDAELELLRIKPERRVVGRLRTPEGPQAVVKAFADDFPAASRAAKLIGGVSVPRTPRRLGRSYSEGVLVSEWLPGLPLGEVLGRDPVMVGVAGAALAALHRRPVAGLHVTRPADEARRLRASAGLIGWLAPDRAEAARNLARDLARRLDGNTGQASLHGDFSADQVVVHDGRVSLLDLDEAVAGDPGRDLGAFLARLLRDVAAGRLDEHVAETAADALLDGYGPVDGRTVRDWTAAALLHLAPEPFRLRDPRWAERVVELVDQAEAVGAS